MIRVRELNPGDTFINPKLVTRITTILKIIYKNDGMCFLTTLTTNKFGDIALRTQTRSINELFEFDNDVIIRCEK